MTTTNKVTDQTSLTFGQTISLAGDFYSNTQPHTGQSYSYQPICGAFADVPYGSAEGRYNDMLSKMVSDDWIYMARVKALLETEHSILFRNNDNKYNSARTYRYGGMPSDTDYLSASYSAYGKIAWTNADHFGEDAFFCYTLGHSLACRKAIDAGVQAKSDPVAASNLLREAFFTEATANHYLTDMFSAGHIRTPRRAFHCPDYTVMVSVGVLNFAGDALPVWDGAARFMHDNDSATGLMVSNKAGDKWIAFGDKQLFEPANTTNFCRAIFTVQTSIDEVMAYFKFPYDGSGAKKVVSQTTNFNTLNMLPIPLPGASNDMNFVDCMNVNPAPLWVPLQANASMSDRWVYRSWSGVKGSSPNNHSAYSFVEGSSGFRIVNQVPVANAEAIKQSSADYNGNDMYPIMTYVYPARGIVQLSQASGTWADPKDTSDYIYATTWDPVHMGSKGTIDSNGWYGMADHLGLRDKVKLQQSIVQDWRKEPLVAVHGWSDGPAGNRSFVLMIRQTQDTIFTGNVDFVATVVQFIDPRLSDDPCTFDPTRKFEPIALKTIASNLRVVLFDPQISKTIDLTDTRFFVTNGTQDDAYITTIMLGDDMVKWYSTILTGNGEDFDGFNVLVTPWLQKTHENDPDWSPRPFLKAWKALTAPDRAIMFCQSSQVANTGASPYYLWRVSRVSLYTPNGNGPSASWTQNFIDRRDNYRDTTSLNYPITSCFLVGDLIGSDLYTIGSDDSFDIVAWLVNGKMESTIICQHTCPDKPNDGPNGASYDGSGRLRDILVAALPSWKGTAGSKNSGYDVLHVSSHNIGGVYYLKFRSHINDRWNRTHGAYVPNTLDYYGTCRTDWIKDDLMNKDRWNDGRYQSLKWLYLPTENESNIRNFGGILEIFSWYGIIGFRLFRQRSEDNKFSFGGCQHYNGQTSGTAGRLYSGTWGDGFFGSRGLRGINEFADVCYYNMVRGGAKGHGYWDSAKQDPYLKTWTDPGYTGSPLRRESDFVRGGVNDITQLE